MAPGAALPAWITGTAIAHRGLHDGGTGVPENSLAAFAAAIDAGYAIELDLQRAADGTPMVFHDSTLNRLTELQGRVAARTADELSKARLLGTDEAVPSFEAALGFIAGRVPVLVEIKNPVVDDGAFEAAVWRILQGYTGAFAVQSFNPDSLGWFARHAPAALRGQIASPRRFADSQMSTWRALLLTHLLLTVISRPHFVAYDVHYLRRPAPWLVRRLDLPLLTWTVRTNDDWQLAKRYADNIIFEGIRP